VSWLSGPGMLAAGYLGGQGCEDGLGDIVLHGEDVVGGAVVGLRPEMQTIGDLDEFGL
jgi:hypothetical protein